ncbi:MAG: EAL domain-containing protein [Burkholderiaceae bacterium]|nr:EAL domain-containing protein [Burkholderiaceae bacterium]
MELSPQLRLRLAVLAMLGVVGLASTWQVWRFHELEAQRLLDGRVHELALSVNALGQTLASGAQALQQSGSGGVNRLSEILGRSQAEALLLDQLVGTQAAVDVESAAALDLALQLWQDTRERLWYRAEAVLNAHAAGGGPRLERAVEDLQNLVAPAAQAAAALASHSSAVAERRRGRALDELRSAGIASVALLLVLALLIGEPTARAVARQHRRLAEQAGELERLALVARRSSNGMLVLDAQGRVAWANEATGPLFGDGLAGRSLADLLRRVGADPSAVTTVELALAGRHHALVQLHWAARDGRQRGLELEVQPVHEAPVPGRAGRQRRRQGLGMGGFIATIADRTEQLHRQETAALLSHTVEAAGLGTWQCDFRSGVVECNDRVLAMLGWRRADFDGSLRSWLALVHPEDRVQMRQAVRAHLADPALPCRVELRFKRPDGDWAVVQSCAVVTERDESGQRALRMAGIHIDLTEQMQMQAMLRHAARTDGLTQMPNRAAVFDQVQQVINRAAAQPGYGYAVLFMDFDRFKQVNDTLGHAAGDELLRQIAQRLRGALRARDLISASAGRIHTAGRIGGDEFVVVLDGVSGRDEAVAVARRLLDVLAAPYQIGSHVVHSSASIGIVTSELAANDAHTVMRDADTAMYEAKRGGLGRWVVFDPGMHERVARGLAIESELRLALERDELFVVYQPVVPLHGQARTGVEALVRWRHPLRGLVSPADFIPVAEESGLISELGQLVLRSACADFMAWQRDLGAAAPASLAVNLSPMQLRAPGLIADVQRCLRDTGIPAASLQLEVTESLAAQDDAARARLRELKALGVRIALDDFGTGYSSLACLHLLPVDTVKVDRSFVSHAETSDYHRVLIEATIRVAQTLGMDTVAEGIETTGQAALMTRLACDRGQGYLFARPLDDAALRAWCLGQSEAAPAVLAA